MKYIKSLFFVASIFIASFTNADSELIGKVVNDNDICSLFYENDRYIGSPKGVFVRSHFKSKKSYFDGNNDGKKDNITLKENFTTHQTNMMYSSLGSDNEIKYIFPQSWMKCKNNDSPCDLNRKIRNGVFNIGSVPGKPGTVEYRSRYTNSFPFMRNGETYYKVTTESSSKDVTSIIKPLSNTNSFELVCAFRKGKRL